MGMQEQDLIPDTFGLPEYYVTGVTTEIDGPNVRVTYYARRHGQVHWLFSKVVRAEHLMQIGRTCQHVAEQAFNLAQMMESHQSH
ncbi:hypothetical protein [Bradyrhizobium cenepequi]|uniref:hypothetical protein n=1 Tax=Bradyrhizobium cenepequi TaxID=2821403 RepID=UPI001CE29421|nr:hypothetical protein [Bradyrhizobium cenepequi]MCA6108156.1 hypothetical protein [Bradyrhizobium cenepequi]